MFSGSKDGYFMVWKLPQCTAILSIKAHEDEIFSIRAFGENLLASAGYDNQILVWKSEYVVNPQQPLDETSKMSPLNSIDGRPKKIKLVNIINLNSEPNSTRHLFITSMVPYSIKDEMQKIVGNLLIIGTKGKFIDIYEATNPTNQDPRTPGVIPTNKNNKKMRIHYKNKIKLEKNQPEKKIKF